MQYSAPVSEMLFAMRELARLDEVAALPGGGELDLALVRSILEQAGLFAEEVLVPLNRIGDRDGARFDQGRVTTPPGFRDAYRKFVEAGWQTLAARPEHGGQGMPHLVAVAVNEIWASANLAFSLCLLANENAAETLARHAPAELKKHYLARIVKGEWTAPMALTEPQAGSDLSLLRTRAVPEGDAYRLFGTKIFITYGEHDLADNIVHLVLARLRDAPEGTRGISLFLVPKFLVRPDGSLGERNDVHCLSVEHKLGIHASPTAVIAYGQKAGAIGFLVGEPNRGLEAMFVMMNRMRLGVGVEGLAMSERAYQQARAYARERVQGRPPESATAGPVPIIRHPDVRRMLMEMKARIEAMRGLSYYAAARMDIAARHADAAERKAAQEMVNLLTPVIKGWQTEQAQEVVSLAVQIHGGSGYVEETGVAQLLRDVRITSIYEATTGIQALDLVSRKVGRDGGATVSRLVDGAYAACRALNKTKGEDERAIAAALEQGIRALEQATRYVVEKSPRAPSCVAAGAVPYLMLLGSIAGGWQLARSALVEGEPSRAIVARYYAEHVLPRARAYAEEVLSGADSVLRLDEAGF
jgi:alkylation response protein AidB-like acyl-CoA dehydrogenase